MSFNHPYLKDKIIDVKPVEAGQKWKGIVSNYREKENDPFLFKKVVKSFELPLNSAAKGGGVAVVMDSVKKSLCPDFMDDDGNPEELAELMSELRVRGLEHHDKIKEFNTKKIKISGNSKKILA